MAVSIGELYLFKERLEAARTPKEFFGPLTGDQKQQHKQLRAHYAVAALAYHPDMFASEDARTKELATALFRQLDALYKDADEQIKNGTYDDSITDSTPTPAGYSSASGTSKQSAVTITTSVRTYTVTAQIAEGTFTSVFSGYWSDNGPTECPVAIKIVRDSADNDLMLREQQVLKAVQLKHLPVLVDTFTTSAGQIGHVLELIKGYDLEDVREKYPDGVPLIHICWMLERFLSGLGYLHTNGFVHGNLEPGNLMVCPQDHNGYLIDFLGAVPNTNQRAFVINTPIYSAPEVALRMPPVPSSDIYSLGQCIVYILGGDPVTSDIPRSVDSRFTSYLRKFLERNPVDRARDAYELHRELSTLRQTLFGKKHQFLDFEM